MLIFLLTALESEEDHRKFTAIYEQYHTRLPDTYRAVLEMKYLMGYSYKKISSRLGISEAAVNTCASRGRALLRKFMEKEEFCP